MGVTDYLWSSKKKDRLFLVDTDGGGGCLLSLSAAPPPPRTPQEPMEFLSRSSWSLSASEVSKAFADKTAGIALLDGHISAAPAAGREASWWLRSWEMRKSRARKKEKNRAEKASMHAALSVAGVAAAVATVSANGGILDPDPKMNAAMTSATQLLASHFLELARQMGVGHDKLAAAIRASTNAKSAGDLLTLTASAATALRASAALRLRLQREVPWRLAKVFPYERFECGGADVFCREGVLLQRTPKGHLHSKHVTFFLNRTSHVLVKLKSTSIAGAFFKNKTGVVCGVCDDVDAWPRREHMVGEAKAGWFGIETTQGLMEFECGNATEKNKWVDGIKNLLDQAAKTGCTPMGESLQLMKL